MAKNAKAPSLMQTMAPDEVIASARFVALTDEERQQALTRAVGIINERHALRPVTADQIHVHAATMSTDAVDSYFSRMHQTSLQNFAAEANEGRAFMNMHKTGFGGRELPLGHTFEGSYGDDGDHRKADASVYMLRSAHPNGEGGVNTDEISRAIDAGTIRDVSVGFVGGDDICDVCGNDLWDYDKCPHIPGSSRKCPEGVVATYSIHNAHLRELSAVYEGATPGAMFSRQALGKTERAIREGHLGAREISFLEERYRMPLTESRKFISLPGKNGTDPKNKAERNTALDTERNTALERSDEMKAKPFVDHLIVRCGAHLPEEVRRALETTRASLADDQSDLTPVLTHVERALTLGHEAADHLAQFRAAGVPDIETARRLERDAAAGRQYRTDLIEEALAEGVRAMGNDFPREMYSRILSEPTRSLDEIKSLRDTWAKQAQERLAGYDNVDDPEKGSRQTGRGGRQTVPLHGFEQRPAGGAGRSNGTARNYTTRR